MFPLMTGSEESPSHRNASIISPLPCTCLLLRGEFGSELNHMHGHTRLAFHQTEDVHSYETLP